MKAPFSTEQVKCINNYQKSGKFHPFTCGECGNDLIAIEEGLICPTETCEYTQDWVHGFMANFNSDNFPW